jgi:mono/diheme cytochrome c family protein
MASRSPRPHTVLAALLLALLSITASAQVPTDAAAISAGEALFKANCSACHKVKQKLVGPALAGVQDRVPSTDWIVAFVQNSQKVIAGGDEYANKIYNEYNKTQMTAFSSLKADQVLSIIAYVNAEAAKADVVAAPAADAGGTTAETGAPVAYLNAIVVGMVVILLLLIVVLGMILTALRRFLAAKDLSEADREVVESGISLSTILQSRGFVFAVTFIVSAVAFKAVINGLYSIGVQKGYSPAQPIAFSHKIHAGQYEIDCNYCHTGAMKGKNANIPSPNICMNCHSAISQGKLTGTAEIAKIYAAVQENKPVEWVRIHNLPDLAYFNHAQHANVGGIACQTCHGPVETMDVVRQHSLLTMGWCIDCHRKTDVNSKGNAYYDKMVELHNAAGKKSMKVEDIGGLECSKCHY